MSEKILLIDGHSILNRAYYGLPNLTNWEGLHTNAVYGFLNIMTKVLEEEKPEYLAVAFRAFMRLRSVIKCMMLTKERENLCRKNCGNRFPLIKEVLTAMGVAIVTKEGYEADDLLGTIAGMAEKKGMDATILSGDRDLLQLATDHVLIRIPKTKGGKTEVEDYHAKEVLETYQVTPPQIIELKALMGDTADNIPRESRAWVKRQRRKLSQLTARSRMPMSISRRSNQTKRKNPCGITMILRCSVKNWQPSIQKVL